MIALEDNRRKKFITHRDRLRPIGDILTAPVTIKDNPSISTQTTTIISETSETIDKSKKTEVILKTILNEKTRTSKRNKLRVDYCEIDQVENNQITYNYYYG